MTRIFIVFLANCMLTGINLCDNNKYHFKYWNNRRWLLLFYHNYKAECCFKNESEVLKSQNPNKFSILSILNDNLKYYGTFEFHLEYQKYKVHWIQRDNPLTLDDTLYTKVPGLQVFQNAENAKQFGGLAKVTLKASNVINSFLDGNPGSGNWYYAIGMYSTAESRWVKAGVPGASAAEPELSLWLRVPYYFCMQTSKTSLKISKIKLFIYVLICC